MCKVDSFFEALLKLDQKDEKYEKKLRLLIDNFFKTKLSEEEKQAFEQHFKRKDDKSAKGTNTLLLHLLFHAIKKYPHHDLLNASLLKQVTIVEDRPTYQGSKWNIVPYAFHLLRALWNRIWNGKKYRLEENGCVNIDLSKQFQTVRDSRGLGRKDAACTDALENILTYIASITNGTLPGSTTTQCDTSTPLSLRNNFITEEFNKLITSVEADVDEEFKKLITGVEVEADVDEEFKKLITGVEDDLKALDNVTTSSSSTVKSSSPGVSPSSSLSKLASNLSLSSPATANPEREQRVIKEATEKSKNILALKKHIKTNNDGSSIKYSVFKAEGYEFISTGKEFIRNSDKKKGCTMVLRCTDSPEKPLNPITGKRGLL